MAARATPHSVRGNSPFQIAHSPSLEARLPLSYPSRI